MGHTRAGWAVCITVVCNAQGNLVRQRRGWVRCLTITPTISKDTTRMSAIALITTMYQTTCDIKRDKPAGKRASGCRAVREGIQGKTL